MNSTDLCWNIFLLNSLNFILVKKLSIIYRAFTQHWIHSLYRLFSNNILTKQMFNSSMSVRITEITYLTWLNCNWLSIMFSNMLKSCCSLFWYCISFITRIMFFILTLYHFSLFTHKLFSWDRGSVICFADKIYFSAPFMSLFSKYISPIYIYFSLIYKCNSNTSNESKPFSNILSYKYDSNSFILYYNNLLEIFVLYFSNLSFWVSDTKN